MRKTALKFGLIAGAINAVLVYALMPFWTDADSYSFGEILGYAAMILALSMIFFGIYQYRKSTEDGKLSFKNAFLLGLSITLIASVIYVVNWMIYSTFINPEFMDEYFDYSVKLIEESDLSQEEIDLKIAQLKEYSESYQNPFMQMGVTFLEIFPIGFVVSIIAALIFKRK